MREGEIETAGPAAAGSTSSSRRERALRAAQSRRLRQAGSREEGMAGRVSGLRQGARELEDKERHGTQELRGAEPVTSGGSTAHGRSIDSSGPPGSVRPAGSKASRAAGARGLLRARRT